MGLSPDRRLLAWGLRGKRGGLPRLWLFTDQHRLPDPRASVAALPRGRAGVVLRHDRAPGRAALGRDIARICRERRLLLVVAGDPRLAAALRAGQHLRGGFPASPIRSQYVSTSSAHTVPDLIRARRAGACLVFLSPIFPTASHQGAPALGPVRWATMVRRSRTETVAAALGGVDGGSVTRIPGRFLRAAGAIGALSSVI
jgi:thiamine-phosphate pyrophosphorylase